MGEGEILLRLSVASIAGALIGLDRELRGIAAGLRTHALVALSSAVIIVGSLILYEDLGGGAGGSGIDPLRSIQGLAQAIGFIAAGTIFFAKGEVQNLTSAANIWLAASLGIVAGAGEYALVGIAMALGIIIVTGVRLLERQLPHSKKQSEED